MNKKGDLAWEYVAAMILALLVIVILLVFTTTLKEKIIEGIDYFTTVVLGR